MQTELSIIIVNYNSAEYLFKCLASIYHGNSDVNLEIIVVDNNSHDDSLSIIRKHYEDATIIANDTNVGFATANNQALEKTAGKYILLLNPDTVLPPHSLRNLIDFLEINPSIGMLSPKLIKADGSLDWACRRNFPTLTDIYIHSFWIDKLFPKSKILNHYSLSNTDPNQPIEIECAAGAFMLVREKAVKDVGLLDQRFFMYFEDLDWSFRFIQTGWKVFYYPKIEVLHYKRGSTQQFVNRMIKEFYLSLYQGYEKYYGHNFHPLINWFVKQTMQFRMHLSLLKVFLTLHLLLKSNFNRTTMKPHNIYIESGN